MPDKTHVNLLLDAAEYELLTDLAYEARVPRTELIRYAVRELFYNLGKGEKPNPLPRPLISSSDQSQ